jgi:hypothetical protein
VLAAGAAGAAGASLDDGGGELEEEVLRRDCRAPIVDGMKDSNFRKEQPSHLDWVLVWSNLWETLQAAIFGRRRSRRVGATTRRRSMDTRRWSMVRLKKFEI